jgi:hypothetical protein
MPLGFAQEKAAPPLQIAERVFEGQLTEVDVDAKQMTVKGANDIEMAFEFTDATEIAGADDSVQGLAGKTGIQVKVTYRESEGKGTATKIEIIEKR